MQNMQDVVSFDRIDAEPLKCDVIFSYILLTLEELIYSV